MTKKLYIEEPNKEELETEVQNVKVDPSGKYWVLELKETILHPKMGGQPSDTGTINGHKVCGVFANGDRNNFNIDHYLEKENIFFKIGDVVKVKLDVKNRTFLSRLHSAGQLVCNVTEAVGGLRFYKTHLYPESTYIAFKKGIGAIDEEIFQKISQTCNAHIKDDLPVKKIAMPGSLMGVQIAEYKAYPCSGTHVATLSEIGPINFIKLKKKGDEIRICFSIKND
jgi:alanyl-tRNA synthetase